MLNWIFKRRKKQIESHECEIVVSRTQFTRRIINPSYMDAIKMRTPEGLDFCGRPATTRKDVKGEFTIWICDYCINEMPFTEDYPNVR